LAGVKPSSKTMTWTGRFRFEHRHNSTMYG